MSGRMTPQKGTDLALVFGQGVRTYRQHIGMKQIELSERAGISNGALASLERAAHGVTLKNAIAVSRVLGKSIEQLITLGLEVNRKCRK